VDLNPGQRFLQPVLGQLEFSSGKALPRKFGLGTLARAFRPLDVDLVVELAGVGEHPDPVAETSAYPLQTAMRVVVPPASKLSSPTLSRVRSGA
jgi:hypothetical protein